MRASEDFSTPSAPGSAFGSGGDAIFYGAIDGTYLLSPHFDLTLGVNGSPASKRDVATSLQVSNGGTGQTVDALVQTRSSSMGAVAGLGYDSFDEQELMTSTPRSTATSPPRAFRPIRPSSRRAVGPRTSRLRRQGSRKHASASRRASAPAFRPRQPAGQSNPT